MSLIMATWVHGNAVVAQHPAGGALLDVDGRNFTAVIGYHEGSMAVYEGTGSTAYQDSDTWFHIPVPTMSWLPTAGGRASGRAFLDTFSVLFTTQNCTVSSVHAWDGGQNRFFAAGVGNASAEGQMSGDWSVYGRTVNTRVGNTPLTLSNIFTPREGSARHAMLFGLGISVRVNFNGPYPRKIVFLGAGANWHDVAVG